MSANGCVERLCLLRDYQHAIEAYAGAVHQAQVKIDAWDRFEVNNLCPLAEDARLRVRRAKATLVEHIWAHECQSPTSIHDEAVDEESDQAA
jgi:hypothetical protein